MSPAKSTTQSVTNEGPGRSTCYDCFRPTFLCCCAALPRIENRTRVVIVQHPRERFHPIGTARLVTGALERAELISASLRELGALVGPLGLDEGSALLFPSADARDLAELDESERPHTVIVLDGTWHQAKTLLRDVPELLALRRVRFIPDEPSNYRIRREPQQSYLSTLESVAHVLERLEPGLDVEPLRDIFREMIDRHIAARRPTDAATRVRLRGRGRAHELPSEFAEPLSAQAIIYAESVRRPTGDEQLPLVVEVLHPESHEARRWFVSMSGDVPARLLEHLGVTPEQYNAEARPAGHVRSSIAEFIGTRRAVSFHPSSVSELVTLGVDVPRSLPLKGAYCDWVRATGQTPERWGSLDEILEREGQAVQPSRAGRSALRLAQTFVLFEYLREKRLRAPDEDSNRLSGN